MKKLLTLIAIIAAVCAYTTAFADDESDGSFSAVEVMSSYHFDEAQCSQENIDSLQDGVVRAKVANVHCSPLMCRIDMVTKVKLYDFKTVVGIICPEDFDEFGIDSLKKRLIGKDVIVRGNKNETDSAIFIYINSPDDIKIIKHLDRAPPPK